MISGSFYTCFMSGENSHNKKLIIGGAVVGIGTLGWMGYTLLHRREALVSEERVLEIFLDPEHPNHRSSVAIMTRLFNVGCTRHEELLTELYGDFKPSEYRAHGQASVDLSRQIGVISDKEFGNRALIKNIESFNPDCRALPPLDVAHYEATHYAWELREAGKFGDLFMPSDNS